MNISFLFFYFIMIINKRLIISVLVLILVLLIFHNFYERFIDSSEDSQDNIKAVIHFSDEKGVDIGKKIITKEINENYKINDGFNDILTDISEILDTIKKHELSKIKKLYISIKSSSGINIVVNENHELDKIPITLDTRNSTYTSITCTPDNEINYFCLNSSQNETFKLEKLILNSDLEKIPTEFNSNKSIKILEIPSIKYGDYFGKECFKDTNIEKIHIGYLDMDPEESVLTLGENSFKDTNLKEFKINFPNSVKLSYAGSGLTELSNDFTETQDVYQLTDETIYIKGSPPVPRSLPVTNTLLPNQMPLPDTNTLLPKQPLSTPETLFRHGCYTDYNERILPNDNGTVDINTNPMEQCKIKALAKNDNFFGLQWAFDTHKDPAILKRNPQCWSGNDNDFNKNGNRSFNCKTVDNVGYGGAWANFVYEIKKN